MKRWIKFVQFALAAICAVLLLPAFLFEFSTSFREYVELKIVAHLLADPLKRGNGAGMEEWVATVPYGQRYARWIDERYAKDASDNAIVGEVESRLKSAATGISVLRTCPSEHMPLFIGKDVLHDERTAAQIQDRAVSIARDLAKNSLRPAYEPFVMHELRDASTWPIHLIAIEKYINEHVTDRNAEGIARVLDDVLNALGGDWRDRSLEIKDTATSPMISMMRDIQTPSPIITFGDIGKITPPPAHRPDLLYVFGRSYREVNASQDYGKYSINIYTDYSKDMLYTVVDITFVRGEELFIVNPGHLTAVTRYHVCREE